MTTNGSTTFLFDYSDTFIPNIYKADVKNYDGYIEVPFKSYESIKSPNAICLPTNTKYKVEKLYIFKNIHNIQQQTYDGELIIEHIPITNDSGNKIYSCFLLKTDPHKNESTVIDDIIKHDFDSKLQVNMNQFIEPNPPCIVNRKNNVFIFTNPIIVKSTFKDFHTDGINTLFNKFLSVDYYSITATHVTELSKNNVIEGFQEGLEGDQSYLECRPTDTSDETIEMYNLQLNGDVITDKTKMQVMTTTINFFVFMIMIGVSASISPYLYKNFVINLIDKAITDKEKAPGSVKGFDFCLTILLVSISIIVCNGGIQNRNTTQTSIGIMMFLFILLSISVITYLKTMYPNDYALAQENKIFEANSEFLSIFPRFIYENIMGILGIYAVIVFVLVSFSLGMYYTKSFSKKISVNRRVRNYIISIGLTYGFFIAVYIAYIFSNRE